MADEAATLRDREGENVPYLGDATSDDDDVSGLGRNSGERNTDSLHDGERGAAAVQLQECGILRDRGRGEQVPEIQIRATWRSVAGVRHGQFKQEKQIKEGITSGATTPSNSWVPGLYARARTTDGSSRPQG
jgi:hypothetical protein